MRFGRMYLSVTLSQSQCKVAAGFDLIDTEEVVQKLQDSVSMCMYTPLLQISLMSTKEWQTSSYNAPTVSQSGTASLDLTTIKPGNF